VLSDLHLERATFAAPPIDADVVVLAGDVALGTGDVQWAREWAGARPVLYVAGNHEFYGHAIPDLFTELRRASGGSPVHVLENDALVLGGVRFLGCTLWSDFEFDGPDRRAVSMEVCERAVNDYRLIGLGGADRSLATDDTLALHQASRRWLTEQLAQEHDGPTVVITHHAPLIRARPAKPLLRALGGAFASDLTELMGADRVALWIYGHTHMSADLELRGTRILSNPRGYPNQHVDGFDPARVIEV
jgi:predicted phosphodiesterase